MARRSPPRVSQTYDTGCTWRMFGIFNSREGHSNRNRRNSSTHTTAAGNGNLRSNSDVLSTIDEKHPEIAVSSIRRRGYSCKSMSFVESDLVADWRNESRKMIVDQRLFNKNSQGKNGEIFQPDQLLDALQILHSNKELFVKLLQDPNSLLVKQIHDLESSQAKEPYHARQKRVTRMNKSQNISARQSGKHFKSFDRCDSKSSFEPHSSNKHSYTNVQNIESSHFPFGRVKRKLRHAIGVRRKDKQLRIIAAVPPEFPCNSQCLEGVKKVKELEIGGRNSPINVPDMIGKNLSSPFNLKMRDKTIMLKDSELCMRQEAASFDESCSQKNNFTSERNALNKHVEGRKSLSQLLNCETEEYKGCTNSEHCGIEELATVNTLGDRQRHFDSDITIIKSLPGDNLHSNYDIPRDVEYKDRPPTQKFGSFLGTETQVVSFPPEVGSSSLSSCQRTEDTLNMKNTVDQFARDDCADPPIPIFQQDESSVQAMHHDEFEENHFADLIVSSLDPINKLTSSNDILDCVKEILQAFLLKRDELTTKNDWATLLDDCAVEIFKEVYQNCCFPPHLSSKDPNVEACLVRKVLANEITELVNLHFFPHLSPLTLQQLVEKDLARRGSWLNIQVDTEDVAMEVEKYVLEKLVFEIASEMHCNETLGDLKHFWQN